MNGRVRQDAAQLSRRSTRGPAGGRVREQARPSVPSWSHRSHALRDSRPRPRRRWPTGLVPRVVSRDGALSRGIRVPAGGNVPSTGSFPITVRGCRSVQFPGALSRGCPALPPCATDTETPGPPRAMAAAPRLGSPSVTREQTSRPRHAGKGDDPLSEQFPTRVRAGQHGGRGAISAPAIANSRGRSVSRNDQFQDRWLRSYRGAADMTRAYGAT
jgi:hypothetical protein